MISSVTENREGLRYAIIVYTSFRIRESAVQGYLVMVLSVVSLSRLILEIEKWEQQEERVLHISDPPM